MAASKNDETVLDSIFSPLLPLGDSSQSPPQTENEINEEITVECKKAKELETLGVEKAEEGDFDGALECFNEACEICPLRSSCFNNRAQLWRLKGKPKLIFIRRVDKGWITTVKDLEKLTFRALVLRVTGRFANVSVR